MTDREGKNSEHILTILGYIFIPIVIILLIPVIPILILHSVIRDKNLARKFRAKYPSKRFLIINKNDPEYLRVYSETLENRIGNDSVVLNELDLEKKEFKLEKRLYKSDLSWKNYLPALIHIDKSINRTGLYYAYKDYLKGKRKRINKILKNLHEIGK